MNDNLHLAGYPLPSAASVAAWEKEARCGSSAAIRPVVQSPQAPPAKPGVKQDRSFQIFVKTLTGKTIVLAVGP